MAQLGLPAAPESNDGSMWRARVRLFGAISPVAAARSPAIIGRKPKIGALRRRVLFFPRNFNPGWARKL
jgi:hypothetical protein